MIAIRPPKPNEFRPTPSPGSDRDDHGTHLRSRHDHHLGREHFDPRRKRRGVDHSGPGGQGSLRPRDIVYLAPDGTREGVHPPSSEFPFHLSIYKARPDIGAIVHAHPGALVSFSICGQVPNTLVFPEAWNVCGKVAFAPYALPGSELLGQKIAAEFESPAAPYCVVLQNHGVVVGADTLAKAFQRFETLEFTANTIINASHARRGPLPDRRADDALEKAPQHFTRTPSRTAVHSANANSRSLICDFVHRAYEHRLMTSTKGSFSARIDGGTFLITPYKVDRKELSLGDLLSSCGEAPFRARHEPVLVGAMNEIAYQGAGSSRSRMDGCSAGCSGKMLRGFFESVICSSVR